MSAIPQSDPADRLLFAVKHYKRSGPSSWMAQCPAHDDSTPSLDIKRLHDGRVLIHCHAGCGATEVLDALGMDYGDLYPGGGYYEPLKSKEMSHEEWILWIAEQDVKNGRKLSEKTKKQILQAKLKLMRSGK